MSSAVTGIEPPASAELERAVLASVLLDSSLLAEVETLVGEGDFADERHQRLFGAIVDLAQSGEPIDEVLVVERLRRKGLLAKAGGDVYIHTLSVDLPDMGRVLDYATEVRRLSAARQVLATLELAQQRVARDRDPEVARDSLAAAQRLLDGVVVEVSGGLVSERLEAAKARLLAIKAGTRSSGIPTGFPSIDEELVGIGRREVVIVGGYAGAGKTSFVEQMIDNWVKAGLRVCYVSLEMGGEQLEDRLYQRAMLLPHRDLRRGRWRTEVLDHAHGQLVEAEWTQRLIWLFPRCSEVRQVVAEVHAAYRLHRFDVLVTDHLNELQVHGTRDNRERVSAAAAAMKDLARELDVAHVVPHQLNREGARGGERPRLWHLTESGKVEQVADVVMLIWAPDGDTSTVREITLAKVRQGESGLSARLGFDPRSRTYRELDTRHEPIGGAAPW